MSIWGNKRARLIEHVERDLHSLNGEQEIDDEKQTVLHYILDLAQAQVKSALAIAALRQNNDDLAKDSLEHVAETLQKVLIDISGEINEAQRRSKDRSERLAVMKKRLFDAQG